MNELCKEVRKIIYQVNLLGIFQEIKAVCDTSNIQRTRRKNIENSPPPKKKKKDNAENYPIELIGNTQ
jgi:hypothetical protein